MKSSLKLSAREVERGKLGQVTFTKAVTLYRLYGVLLIHDLLPKELVETMRREYLKDLDVHGRDWLERRCLQVGHERFMTTVPLDGAFADTRVWASPILLALLRELLGEICVLNSFGAVVALPGSESQHHHLDHPRLFHSEEVNAALPPYAITVMIPLVDLNEVTGTTRVWEGSHAVPDDSGLLLGSSLVKAETGACFLMDSRVWHGGTENRGEQPRPLLYSLYSRPWFLDSVNYQKQARLEVPRPRYESFPEEVRPLLRFATVT